MQDPGGTLTEYGYDLKDRIVEVRSQGQVRERYRYDSAGNIVEKTDGQGRVLLQWKPGPATLDAGRRLNSGEVHSFEYDEGVRSSRPRRPAHRHTFAFDELGRRLLDKRDGIGVEHQFNLETLKATISFDKFRVSYKTVAGDLIITDPTGSSHRVRVQRRGLIARHLAGGMRNCAGMIRWSLSREGATRKTQHRAPWMRRFEYSPAGDLRAVADTVDGVVRYRHDRAHNIAEETLPDGSRRAFDFDAARNLLRQPGLVSRGDGFGQSSAGRQWRSLYLQRP